MYLPKSIRKTVIAMLVLSAGLSFAQEEKPTKQSAVFTGIESSEMDKLQYDLNDAEVARVAQLRIIDRAYSVANLSALELLGKYAKTDIKRREYARKHVLAMADNVGRSQAWGMAVYAATQETDLVDTVLSMNPTISDGLTGLGMAIPKSDYSEWGTGPQIRTDPKRTLMISLDCGDPCDDLFAKEYSLVMENKLEAIDVVFVNSDESDTKEIFDWAKSMAISKQSLEAGSVNLHIDDEEFAKMRNGLIKVPRLIRQ